MFEILNTKLIKTVKIRSKSAKFRLKFGKKMNENYENFA